jgi:hypothetical protein
MFMIRDSLNMAVVATTLMVAGCQTTTTVLAPGAASVRIVRSEADIASCKAVGNVRQPPDQAVDMRNLTVGVGGDTLFVTEETKTKQVVGSYDYIVSGVAYRCSK